MSMTKQPIKKAKPKPAKKKAQQPEKPRPEGYSFGRPTSYRPEYCEQVIEWGRQGKSRTWMSAHLGIDRYTIDEWAKAHPDFSRALSHAKAFEQALWEDLGFNGLSADKFNSGVWTRSMAARFPSEWRESQNIATTHAGSIAHSVEIHIVDPTDDKS